MFSIHTHPGDDPVNSPQYVSGYNTTKIIGSDLTVLPPFKFDDNPYGDRGTVWDTYGRIQARDIENKRVRSKYPPFYIYHIKSQNRILYNPFNKCINNVSSTNSRLRGLKARHLIGQSVRAVIL